MSTQGSIGTTTRGAQYDAVQMSEKAGIPIVRSAYSMTNMLPTFDSNILSIYTCYDPRSGCQLAGVVDSMRLPKFLDPTF